MDVDKVRPLWQKALERRAQREENEFDLWMRSVQEAFAAGSVEVTPEDIAVAEQTLLGVLSPKLHEGLEWEPVAMPNVGV